MSKKRDELKDLRQFGIALGAILAIFGLIHFFKGRVIWYPWFFGTGLVIFCMAIIMPGSLRTLYSIFTKAARAIGWFNTRVILILIYGVMVIPIALFMKMLRKDPLSRKIEKEVSSYWVKRSLFKQTKERLEKQF